MSKGGPQHSFGRFAPCPACGDMDGCHRWQERESDANTLTEHLQAALKDAMKPVLFPEAADATLANRVADVVGKVVEPIIAAREQLHGKAFVVTPVPPQPGDDPLTVKLDLKIAGWVVKDWPADRLLAVRIKPKDVLDLYGVTLDPWNNETAAEFVAILAAWERNLRVQEGEHAAWTRRITDEMLHEMLRRVLAPE